MNPQSTHTQALTRHSTWRLPRREAGGGISWEKLKVLAKLHDVEPDYILTGEHHPAEEAISPAEAKELREQLERIEKKLDELLKQRDAAKTTPRRLQEPTRKAGQPKPQSR